MESFRASEQYRGSVSERKYDEALSKWYKVLKIMMMVIVFFVTLAAAVVAKGATFFMVSQVAAKPKNMPFCVNSLRWLLCIFFAFAAP